MLNNKGRIPCGRDVSPLSRVRASRARTDSLDRVRSSRRGKRKSEGEEMQKYGVVDPIAKPSRGNERALLLLLFFVATQVSRQKLTTTRNIEPSWH